jgi:hypothetical protein
VNDETQQDQAQPDQADGSQDQGAESQGQSDQDSQLETSQPDQPAQPETERQVSQPDAVGGSTGGVGPSGEPAEGTVRDQAAEAVAREGELESARSEHNERTGGGDVQPGEVQNARQEHNDRTGGGQVPGADSADDGPESGLGQE